MTTKTKTKYPVPAHFTAWLDEEGGRANYFTKIDRGLFPAVISKLKSGDRPITFQLAIRLERAQPPSDTPLKAERLMTFLEDRVLYRYVTGQEPAPPPVEPAIPNRHPKRTLAIDTE